MRTRRDPDTALPEPDADARAHAARVRAAIVSALEARGGFLPVRDYVELALHAPGLGYYAAGARKFGAAGDFTTAPEMTPLFGAALACQVARILEATEAREIVELGAGSGGLAIALLRELDRLDALPSRYAIVEPSPDLRERQQAAIVRDLPSWSRRVAWLDAPPPRIDGAILMNEVLDAVPPDVVARIGGRWHERGVTLDRHGNLALADRALADAALEALARERFPGSGDYASEIPRAAEALVEDLGRRLASGALVAIDYGFPRSEFYHPERSRGTMMAHYRHRATEDIFLWPGLADLTTHIDFTGVAEAGARAGLGVAGYASQAAFLIGCGILDRLAAAGDPSTPAYLREAGAVQQLLSPAEMGEIFKVIALERGEAIRWPGFALGDASYRL
ncbi:MAG: SAM-dependent methyltransferase [Burkholderiales bacterium]|nr:SAM-dependent methyltransferase [Burkholderiales bacterium]MCE7876572.1 class I SAM-dependent methyltransferase [Betaproteobacteria bacterium PRO3]